METKQPLMSLPPSIKKAGEESKLKMLVYGNSGTGKTRLLASANEDDRTYPILILDFEAGTQSIAGGVHPVDVWTMSSLKDLVEAQNYLSKGQHPFKSVGIDSLSEIHQQCIATAMNAGSNRSARPGEAEQPQQKDYLIALLQMRKIVRSFRDLPLHVFMTALLREELDQREGLVRKPALAGAFCDEVGGVVDVLGYYTSRSVGPKTQRVLITGNQANARAKFRVPLNIQAPETIPDPTITKILDIKEGKGGPV